MLEYQLHTVRKGDVTLVNLQRQLATPIRNACFSHEFADMLHFWIAFKNFQGVVALQIESFSHDLERTKTKDDTQTNQRGDRSRETQYFVLTCIDLSLLVSTIQWNPAFDETDQSDQCDGVSLAVLAG